MKRSLALNPIEPEVLSFRVPAGLDLNMDVSLFDVRGQAVDTALAQPKLELAPRSGGAVQQYPAFNDIVALGVATFAIPGADLKDRNGYEVRLYALLEGVLSLIGRGLGLLYHGTESASPGTDPLTPQSRGIYNLNIIRSDSYTWQFVLWGDTQRTIPSDLRDATVTAQIRETIGGAILVNLACTIKDAVNGIVWVDASSMQTSGLPEAAFWDMQITYAVDGEIKTPVGGRVTVKDDITRP